MNRHTPALMSGDAIASEIVNDGWRQYLKRTELPIITAHTAGQNLARITHEHELTLFAHYSTDHVGHTRDMAASIAALQRVDEFMSGLLSSIDDDVTIVLASDHGNLEDVRTGHTMNPAVGLFIGGQHRVFAKATALTDVAPLILQLANT
jgi:bisphosphoglycerate-independent phosphoglycerate mutase (AlkP superfamily)